MFSLNPVLRYVLLLLAGVLQAFSMAWPLRGIGSAAGTTSGSLQVLALAAALWLTSTGQQVQTDGAAMDAENNTGAGARRQTLWRRLGPVFWQGFWRGWCFASAWLAATFWWLYVSLHVYGGLPGWLAVLAVLLLAVALALYYALACAVWLRLSLHLSRAGQGLLFVALWLLAELCRGVLFTGFPWGAVGYAHVDGALAGYAPWLGVYGIGTLATLLAVLLCQVGRLACKATACNRRQCRWMSPALSVAVVAIILGMGSWQKQTWAGKLQSDVTADALRVDLLQGNIAQEEKFQSNGGMELALAWYWEQLHGSQADLVVLPETALPALPQTLPEGYWQGLQQRFAASDKPRAALIGMFARNEQGGYANAVIGMATGGAQAVGNTAPQAGFNLPLAPQAEYRYAKHHLVPFGEFIPPGFDWFINMMNIPLGDQQRGDMAQPRMLFGKERLQPNICYEDLFGEELATSFIDPDTAPTILVNMSNIAWFGDTVAIDQHRHISRMRAMELARPMLRATNTGATAVIDATGQVVQEFPRLSRGVLQAEIAGNHASPTFFAWWAARYWLWPLWLLAAGTIAALSWRAYRNRSIQSGK